MKRSTRNLVLVGSAVYYTLLFLVYNFTVGNVTNQLFFLAGPLAGLVFVLAGYLSRRATVPTKVEAGNPPSRRLAREVQELTRQIEVGSRSGPEYFEDVLLARLREVLVEKVSVQTGMSPQRAREMLANTRLGPGLLRDETLYRLLYSPLPGKGPGRVRMLTDAVARIEDWKS